MLNGLDLFSGIGGLTLALSEWVRPVAYCEIDPYCQAVLQSRFIDGRLPAAPIWDNIRTLRARDIKGPIDIIYGGFPVGIQRVFSVQSRGWGYSYRQ